MIHYHTRQFFRLGVVLSSVLVVACGDEPGANSAAATVSESGPQTTTTGATTVEPTTVEPTTGGLNSSSESQGPTATGTSSTPDNPTLPTGICAVEEAGVTADGDPVTRCKELHAERPYLHFDDDVVDGTSATMFVAVYPGYNLDVIDRYGNYYAAVDSNGTALVIDGQTMTISEGEPDVAITDGLRMPSMRFAYLLYRVHGELRTTTLGGKSMKGIHLTSASPVVLLEASAIDGRLGAWEGEVTRRKPDGTWDETSRVRFRARFDATSPLAPLPETTKESPALADGTRLQALGVIENWSAPVRAADGTCLKALTSLGEENPFFGATTPEVKLQREFGMHGYMTQSDVVFTYPPNTDGLSPDGMGTIAPFIPYGLFRVDPENPADDLTITPHGNAMGHSLDMHRVSGGGEDC